MIRSEKHRTFKFCLTGRWDGVYWYISERVAMYMCFPKNTHALLVTDDNRRYTLGSIDFKTLSCWWVPTDEKYPTNTTTIGEVPGWSC